MKECILQLVIDFMLMYHFVDRDLGIEIFFRKERATEKGKLGIETEGTGTCCTLFLKVKKNSQQIWLLFHFFSFMKKQEQLLQKMPVLFSIDYWIILICLVTVLNCEKDKVW